MSAYIWCEFVCARCAATTSGTHTKGAIPRREMTAQAKLIGWQFSKNGNTHCKKCAATYKKGK